MNRNLVPPPPIRSFDELQLTIVFKTSKSAMVLERVSVHKQILQRPNIFLADHRYFITGILWIKD